MPDPEILPLSIGFSIDVDGVSLEISSSTLYFSKPGVEVSLDEDRIDEETGQIIVPLDTLTAAVGELNRLWESYYLNKSDGMGDD